MRKRRSQLSVEGGELRLTDCSIEPDERNEWEAGGHGLQRRLDSMIPERALTIVSGGLAVMIRITMRGHRWGAMSVDASRLLLIECSVQDCHAPSGGAIAIGGDSFVSVLRSIFASCSAAESGGAVVVGGSSNATIEASSFADNYADERGGALQVCADQMSANQWPIPMA